MHTLLVLWRAVKDPLYQKMNKREKNIIKWALLLHDIRKLSIPMIQGKDHVHPFKSASSVLDVLKFVKMIKQETDDQVFAVMQATRLVEESIQPLENRYGKQKNDKNLPLCTVIHSHHALD